LRGGTPTEKQKIEERHKQEKEKERALKLEQQKEEWSREFLSKVVRQKTGRMSEEYMEKLMTETRPNDKKHVKITYDFGTVEGMLDKDNSGIAIIDFKTGDIYNGDLLNGVKHGNGTFIGFDGEEYNGKFFNDKSNGFGIEKYPCKNEDGMLNGKFQYYEGNFLNDKYDGKGKFTDCIGQVYIGDFKNHRRNGFGKQNYLSGRIYEGEWNENRRHGLGKLIEGDTIIYDGEWENGNMVDV
jgi:hypothetical protein